MAWVKLKRSQPDSTYSAPPTSSRKWLTKFRQGQGRMVHSWIGYDKFQKLKLVKDVYRREGVPPIIEKTFNNIWDAFMKTQPRILSTSTTASASGLLVDSDLWAVLQKCMERYGMNPNIVTKIIRLCKRRFGEKLTPAKIKILLW